MPRNYIKSSHTSVLPRPNTSTASKSALCDPLNIISPCNTVVVDHIMYTIEELTGIGSLTHNTIRDAMKTWMSKQLTPNFGSKPFITTEVGLGEIGFDQLCVTLRKIADIAIKHDDTIYVQFEVESNRDRDATIKKLTYGLVDQLRYLKNIGVSTNQISGFYIPVTSRYVEVIECMWADELLKFEISSHPLQKEEVLPKIKEVYRTLLLYEPDGSCTDFKVSLTTSFVEETWGRDAFQWKSGESIVIFSPSDNSVYKHPLNADEYNMQLHYLQQLNRQSFATLQHSSLPVNVILKDSISYFKYPMYSSHLSRDDARACVTVLVDQVAAALQELHQVKLAHQDIQLENICFNEGSVVLVDLDRSCSVDKRAFSRNNKYGKSTMYSFPTSSPISWTAENIDWRQFAIMIHYIVTDAVSDYHKLQLDGTHRFLSTMFNEG